LRLKVRGFLDDHIMPRLAQWNIEVHAGQYPVSFMEDLKALAKSEGLWNMFLPHLRPEEPGTGLSNLIGEEGGGFMIAQARLGPGCIHHCMRAIGLADVCLELMVDRALERKAFGKYLYQLGSIGEWIARSRIEIEQARLLVLKAASMIDQVGAKGARREVSMIKVIAPSLLTNVADRAMQVYGAMGVSPDTPLADFFTALDPHE
jgi:alkylation response protein AidB-like acyl-CoA dehydrogenase